MFLLGCCIYCVLFLNVFVASQSEIARKMANSTSLDYDERRGEGKGLLSRSEITQDEHPLSLGKTSIWNQFFQVPSSYQSCFLVTLCSTLRTLDVLYFETSIHVFRAFISSIKISHKR